MQQQLGHSGEATEPKRQREENSVRQGKNHRQCNNRYNPRLQRVMYV